MIFVNFNMPQGFNLPLSTPPLRPCATSSRTSSTGAMRPRSSCHIPSRTSLSRSRPKSRSRLLSFALRSGRVQLRAPPSASLMALQFHMASPAAQLPLRRRAALMSPFVGMWARAATPSWGGIGLQFLATTFPTPAAAKRRRPVTGEAPAAPSPVSRVRLEHTHGAWPGRRKPIEVCELEASLPSVATS